MNIHNLYRVLVTFAKSRRLLELTVLTWGRKIVKMVHDKEKWRRMKGEIV